jgi:hypothetical protein
LTSCARISWLCTTSSTPDQLRVHPAEFASALGMRHESILHFIKAQLTGVHDQSTKDPRDRLADVLSSRNNSTPSCWRFKHQIPNDHLHPPHGVTNNSTHLPSTEHHFLARPVSAYHTEPRSYRQASTHHTETEKCRDKER